MRVDRQMATDEKASKWKKAIFIIIGILVLLMIMIGLMVGLNSLRKFFIGLLVAILIISILSLLIYGFWLIFIKKEYVNIPANYRKQLIQTAKLMKNEMLGNLYLTGDSKHNKIKLGKFAYLRMQLPKQSTEFIETKEKGEFGVFSKPKEVNSTTVVDIDCFIVFKDSIIEKLFGTPMFILTKPEDHDYSSIFSDVYLNGFNLLPISGEFYCLNNRNLDTDIIKGMNIMFQKEVVDEIFRSLDKLVKMSMNLDQEHQKAKEKNLQFDIPQINTGEK